MRNVHIREIIILLLVSSKRHAFYAVMNELMGRPLQAPAYTFTQQLARFWWPSAQVGEASAEKKRKRPEGTIDDVAHYMSKFA